MNFLQSVGWAICTVLLAGQEMVGVEEREPEGFAEEGLTVGVA